MDDQTQSAEKNGQVEEQTQQEKVQVEETVKEESQEDTHSEPKQEESPAKEEAKPAEIKQQSKPVAASLEKIIESIEKLSVLELSELVHALEDRFGVSAQAPLTVAAGPAAASPSAGEPQEEQTTFNVILTSVGANKISAIKAVRELVPTLGLKEAKDLVEAAPKPVMEGVNKATAEEAKKKLTAVGASVDLQ